MPERPSWLAWAREIQSLAQAGRAYTRDVYDRERYERLLALAADFFSFSALPPLSEKRTSEAQIAEIQAHLADPGRPASFD